MSNVYEITTAHFGDYSVFESIDAINSSLASAFGEDAHTLRERGNGIYTPSGERVGNVIDFEAAVQLMDNGIREAVHADLSPCSEAEFFEAYQRRHATAFGQMLVVA